MRPRTYLMSTTEQAYCIRTCPSHSSPVSPELAKPHAAIRRSSLVGQWPAAVVSCQLSVPSAAGGGTASFANSHDEQENRGGRMRRVAACGRAAIEHQILMERRRRRPRRASKA